MDKEKKTRTVKPIFKVATWLSKKKKPAGRIIAILAIAYGLSQQQENVQDTIEEETEQ